MTHALRTAIVTACIVGLSASLARAERSPYSGGGTGDGSPESAHPRAATSWSIEITKDGVAVGSGYCGIGIYTAVGGEPCDNYVTCENPGTPNFICSSGQISCSATDDADDLADAIAAGLNVGCASLVTASADGAVVTITTAASDAESCVFSSEMGSVSGFALGVNVGDFDSGTCEARNVCDGVGANEPSTEALSGGFSFAEVPPVVSVSTMGTGTLALLGLLLPLVGYGILRRGHARRDAPL